MSLATIISLFAIAALLSAVGGLFAATEAAYSVSSRADLEQLARENPKQAGAITQIAHNRASHVNTINFVRVIAETFAAVLITVALDAVFDNLWWTLFSAVLVMSFVTFVLVGASPRSVGMHYPAVTIRITAHAVRALRAILGPIATSLIRFGDRISPGRGSYPGHFRDEQQLLSMVDQAVEHELIEEDEQDFIHSVVEFGETVVREVMVPRTDMVTTDETATVHETFELILSSRHSRLPVASGGSDEIAGVVYLRDLAKFIYRRPSEATTAQIKTLMKPAQFVPDLQRADDLMRQMQQRANHLALAVDEYGGIAGLVTLEDLIEELVGDISDEYDRETDDITPQGDDIYTVGARVEISTLGELFGIELDDKEVETVGGLIAKYLGRLPDEGDVVIISGIKLTVLETERKRQRLISARAQLADQTPTSSVKVIPVDLAIDGTAVKEERS